MPTNDPSDPSPFEPPRPHEVAPHPLPPGVTPADDAVGGLGAAADTTVVEATPAPPTEPTPVVREPVATETLAAVPAAAATQPAVTQPVAAKRKHGPVRLLAILVAISGVILIAAGVVTWFVVRDQLSAEKITVAEDASHFAGDAVDGPLTAYAQADVIEKHALEAGGGKTYSELPRDDPRRDTVMTASFLRASLYTSVVSFGVAAFAAGVGLVLILIGWALLRVDRSLRRLAMP